MIELTNSGMTKEVGLPKYGQQDIGITPAGASDQFALCTARNMLGDCCKSYEFAVIPPHIKVTEEITCLVTGAPRETFINGNHIEHATTFTAVPGDNITFGSLPYGFRTYISMVHTTCGCIDMDHGTKFRGEFDEIATWTSNAISVIPGPEYNVLKNPEQFFEDGWKVGLHDDMGMRLEGIEIDQKEFSMVSAPVANGTVQLTPNGPIILLRNRQTVGGYPRVFNVISTDLDMLAQYKQGNCIKFQQVNRKFGVNTLRQQEIDLNKLK